MSGGLAPLALLAGGGLLALGLGMLPGPPRRRTLFAVALAAAGGACVAALLTAPLAPILVGFQESAAASLDGARGLPSAGSAAGSRRLDGPSKPGSSDVGQTIVPAPNPKEGIALPESGSPRARPVTAVQGFVDLGAWGGFFTAFAAGLTALVLLFAHPYAGRRGFGGDELYGLLLWACLGMAILASATHWLAFFLGYELLSLCLYVLVALPRRAVSAETGLKYFFLGAVTTSFVAFGIALLYAATGTFDIATSVAAGARPWVALGLACLLVGVGFKLSLAPFHLWTPDVYQGAPAPVTAFLAAGSKAAVFGALLRGALVAGPEVRAAAAPVLWVMAVLTAAMGAVGALTQPRAKRLLAYSSIAQIGTLLTAVLAVGAGGGAAALFYLVAYAAAEVGVFGLLGSLSPAAWEGDLDALEDLKGLGQRHPWRSAGLAACLVSLAGLPPIGGFFAKLGVFVATFRAGFLGLGIWLLLTTVPAAYLYLRLAVSLYRPPGPSSHASIAPRAARSELLAAGLAVLLLVWLGVWPSPWLAAARVALTSFPFPH